MKLIEPLRFLSREDMEKIHTTAKRILEKVGFQRVFSLSANFMAARVVSTAPKQMPVIPGCSPG